MMDSSEYLEFAKTLALNAGEIMLKYFQPDIEQREKEDKTLVTIADEEINRMVIKKVEEAYPTHSIFGEEASLDKKSEFVWYCDPVDGTVPYAKGIPVSVFSLALAKDGEPLVGVVYDPFLKNLYYATKGNGAFLNGKRLEVSNKSLHNTTLNIEWWPRAKYDINTPLQRLSVDNETYVLHLGSTVRGGTLVASGLYEAEVFAGDTNLHSVDIAALKVIVEEAGGKVTDLFGGEIDFDNIRGAVLSNGVVHDEILKYLRS